MRVAFILAALPAVEPSSRLTMRSPLIADCLALKGSSALRDAMESRVMRVSTFFMVRDWGFEDEEVGSLIFDMRTL